MKTKQISFVLGLICIILSACLSNKDYKIIVSPEASSAEMLASREIRSIYLPEVR